MPVAREALGVGQDWADLNRLGFYLNASLLMPGQKGKGAFFAPNPVVPQPFVSCIMPTRGHLFPARHAIECFRRQTYANRELVVICASADSEVERHVAELADPSISFHRADRAVTCGALRNEAVVLARGELVCMWDDDDLSHPDRIATQVSAIRSFEAKACVMWRELIWWPTARRLAVSPKRIWENSMLAERAALPAYPDVERGGDTHVSAALRRSAPIVMVDRPACYCYVFHGRNLWPAEHFDMLIGNATERFEGERYEVALADLATELPVAAYVEALSRSVSAG